MTETLPTTGPATTISADGGLRRNNLGLSHAIVISVAVMSPAASIFFNTIPQAGLVGAAIPLCSVVGFVGTRPALGVSYRVDRAGGAGARRSVLLRADERESPDAGAALGRY